MSITFEVMMMFTDAPSVFQTYIFTLPVPMQAKMGPLTDSKLK